MKIANRKFNRLLACALVFLLAMAAAVPVFAASVEQRDLQVVIHNNEGLPTMTTTQFTVYQLFTGTPNKEGNAVGPQYGAENWNNYTLADVEWGESIKKGTDYDYSTQLLAALTGLVEADAAWAFEENVNVFASVTTAADLAKVLEGHKSNEFMQHFAATVAGVKDLQPISVEPELHEGKAEGKDVNADDYLTYTFLQPGYYMFADTHILSTTEADAHSEYIIAVLGDQEINLKASVPTVDKEIVESSNTKKGDVAGVNDYVQFKLTGTLPQNFADFVSYTYIFHDTLSAGLTYVKGDVAHPLTVTVYPSQTDANNNSGGVVVPATYAGDPGANYTVSESGTEIPPAKTCNLEVSFQDLKTLMSAADAGIAVTKDSVFVVTYYAQVNKNAVILDDGNPNTVLLEYSNDPNHGGTGKTIEKTVYVYAFGLDLTKVGSDAAHQAGLDGAGFVLKDKDGNYAIFQDQYILTAEDGTQTFYDTQDEANTAKGETDGLVTGPVRRLIGWTGKAGDPKTEDVKIQIQTYQDAKKAAAGNLDTLKTAVASYLLETGTGSVGEIPDVYGLDEGEYFLEEVIVPDGYNTPKKDFDIKIDATIDGTTGKLQQVDYTHDGKTTTYSATADGDLVARFQSGLLKDSIENQKAPLLPFTGGIGTLIFYVLGAALIAGAVTYLVIISKKRKKAEEKAQQQND